MPATRCLKILTLLMLLVPPSMGGCDTPPVVPPAEAVLSGTWDLTSERNLGWTRKVLTFNSKGELVQIGTKSINIFGDQQTVTEQDLNLPTTVNGLNVEIELTGGLIYNGTLNDAINSSTGSLSVEVAFFNTIISTDQGAATLVRQ